MLLKTDFLWNFTEHWGLQTLEKASQASGSNFNFQKICNYLLGTLWDAKILRLSDFPSLPFEVQFFFNLRTLFRFWSKFIFSMTKNWFQFFIEIRLAALSSHSAALKNGSKSVRNRFWKFNGKVVSPVFLKSRFFRSTVPTWSSIAKVKLLVFVEMCYGPQTKPVFVKLAKFLLSVKGLWSKNKKMMKSKV